MVTGTIRQTQEGSKQYPTQFIMIKNAVGGLSVQVEPYDFSAPSRRVSFKFDQERNYLPAKWAVGVFVSTSALKQMELGYFTFENLDVLIKMAEDLGLYVPDSIKEPKVTLKEIAKALRSGEKSELEKITKNMTTKVKKDVMATAQKMYNALNHSTIEFLEKELKVSLKPVDLSE
jgi:hypothetical protein